MKAFEAMLDINVLGPVRVAKAFAPLLIRTANHPDVAGKLPKDRSVVVNIGSVAAWGTPWQVPYAASKVCQYYAMEHMDVEACEYADDAGCRALALGSYALGIAWYGHPRYHCQAW